MNSLITMAPLLLNTPTAFSDYKPMVQIDNVYKDAQFKESLYEQAIPKSIFKLPQINLPLLESAVDQFFQELKQKIDIFGKFNAEVIVSGFSKTIASLLLLNPEKIGIELTSLGSIFIVSEIKSKKIYLELFFENELNLDVEAVLNIYENKEQLLSVNGSINQIINELNENVNRNLVYYYNPSSVLYELSGNPSTYQAV